MYSFENKDLLFLMYIFTFEFLQRISVFLNGSNRCFNFSNLVWTEWNEWGLIRGFRCLDSPLELPFCAFLTWSQFLKQSSLKFFVARFRLLCDKYCSYSFTLIVCVLCLHGRSPQDNCIFFSLKVQRGLILYDCKLYAILTFL